MRATSVSERNFKRKPVKRLVHYIPTVVVICSIAYLSLIRETGFSLPLFFGWDKVVHFIMYFVLAAVMLMDTRRDKRQSRTAVTVIFVLCTLYGGVIEILQERFFYPRTGDWWDWAADSVGAAIGICVMLLLWNQQKKEGIS